MRATPCLSVALGMVLLAGIAPALAAPPGRRPNVLLILVDDLKPALGAFGDTAAVTPKIDELAARGVRFERGYANQAVCAPSRFNLMLGSRSTSTGLYGLGENLRQHLPAAVTLPQHFARHGYRTESLGKVFHVGHGNLGDPQSFSVPHFGDKVIEYLVPASTGGQLTREEAYFENARPGAPNRSLPRGAAWESPDVPDEAYADGRVASEAIRRLEAARDRPEPFFMAVGFARPHLPFSAPKKYWDVHDPAKLPLTANPLPPEGAPPYALKRLLELNQYAPVPDQPPLDESLQRRLIHGYYASTSYMDAQVGRVLDALNRLRLADNTIVVFWGDNGYSLGTHGDWTKHSNYEEANRIPFIFAGPGVVRGAKTKSLIETVDVFPTLCALAGLPAPGGPQPIDGVSQVVVLRDPNRRVKDDVYHAFPRGRGDKGEWLGRAIRTERYRLVEWTPFAAGTGVPEWELYDYLEDPLERVNLASRRPTVVRQLRGRLARHPGAKLPVHDADHFGNWPAGTSPREIGRRVTENFLGRPHMPMWEDTVIHYAEAVTWYGAMAFARATGDAGLQGKVVDRFEPLFGEERRLIPDPDHVDWTVFAAVPLEIYLHNKDLRYLALGEWMAQRQWGEPYGRRIPPDARENIARGLSWQTRLWIDDMFMITMAQAQAYRATGQRFYIDRAAREMVHYLDRLQQPTGLFFHAPDARYYWARGNGWMAAGMAELLRALPADNPDRPRILAGYHLMMSALLRHQAAGGLWRQLVDGPDSWLETSGSAMFTFAFITGVKEGWLDAGVYGPAARRAWLALTEAFDADANLRDVCEGTGTSTERSHYLERQRLTGDFHGQAPMLWCASAMLR